MLTKSKSKSKYLFTGSLVAIILSTNVMANPDLDDEQQAEYRTYEHHQKGYREHRGEGTHNGMKGLRMAFSHLDLTDQQKESLKSLKESNKDSMQVNFKAMKELKQKMRPLLEASTIDENAIKNLSAQIADLKAEQMIKMAMLKNQAVALLTDEQKAKFEEMKKKHQKAEKERRTRD